jgi:hypothetical protein
MSILVALIYIIALATRCTVKYFGDFVKAAPLDTYKCIVITTHAV